ncbi:MAG TPA: response regulator [Fibrobacteraceae bacterium]|nr:response regulator [Fibrobacteraceae bacterium]
MKGNILIMEDSVALLKLTQAILEKNGYSVDIATDGKQGLQKVYNQHFDLVLVDLMMPVMDGFEVIERLHTEFPSLPLISFSAHPAHLVEKKALSLGAHEFLQKPLKEITLLAFLRKYLDDASSENVTEEVFLPHDNDQPYLIQLKCCHICGYDHVNVFRLRPGALREDWVHGLFPIYHAAENFQKWNFLRTMVSVCPSCLFASIDPDDFALDRNHLSFPYKLDAKKILARSITTRKKFVDNKDELSLQFTNPNRKNDVVIKSFLLAERCANGLVLGDKDGVYCDLGLCILMRGLLDYVYNGKEKTELLPSLREALSMFLNQLKVPNTRRRVLIRAYYFIITLHIALSESILANEMKTQLEKMYEDVPVEDTSEEERLWSERLQNVWTNGVDLDNIKNLDCW